MLVLLLEDFAKLRRAFGRPLLRATVAASAVRNLEGSRLLRRLRGTVRCVPLLPGLRGSRAGVRHTVLYIKLSLSLCSIADDLPG